MPSARLTKLYWLLAAMGAFLCLAVMLNLPADPKNSILWGYSSQRLALMAIALLGGTLCSIFFLLGFFRPATASRPLSILLAPAYLPLLALSAPLAWIIISLPAYRLGAWQGYFDRLYPLLAWGAALLFQTLFFAIFTSSNAIIARARDLFRRETTTLRRSALILSIFLASWLFIAITTIGLTPDRDLWNEAGVPVLGLQIWLALGLSAAVAWASIRYPSIFSRTPWVDVALFAILAGLAFFIWNSQPITRNYFTTRPISPNFEYYPFSDSAIYDLGGQYLLLGQGVNNGVQTDKPLYMALIAVFHALSGPGFENIIFFQTALLALLPALLYLLGRELHSRALGVGVGLLAIFKELNGLRATLDIQLITTKFLMTEYVTALMLVLITLWTVRWLKRGLRPIDLLWLGGLIGLAGLLRPNPLILAIIPVLLILFLYRSWSERVKYGLVFGAGLILTFIPYLLAVELLGGGEFLLAKIRRLFEGRYQRSAEISPFVIAPLPVMPVSSAGLGIPSSPTPRFVSQSWDWRSPFVFVPSHFSHNLVTALVILPMRAQLDDIGATIAHPAWKLNWSGELTLENIFFIACNLFLLSIGLASAWRKGRLAGLIPLFVMLAYFLANALARTSGSRYLAPADWAIYFYYLAGTLQVALWIAALFGAQRVDKSESAPIVSSSPSRQIILFNVAALLILGLSLPLANQLIPAHFAHPSTQQNLQFLRENGLNSAIKAQNISIQQLNSFLKQKKAVIIQGRALYPRFFVQADGLCEKCSFIDRAFQVKNQPRLAFLLAGQFTSHIILPMPVRPQYFPHGLDVYVIGCAPTKNYTVMKTFMVVVVLDGQIAVYSPNRRVRC